jgi:hypothetical protein
MRKLLHIIPIPVDADALEPYRMKLWCTKQFGHEYWSGNRVGTWQSRFDYNYNNYNAKRIFCFEYESDAMRFALRWI